MKVKRLCKGGKSIDGAVIDCIDDVSYFETCDSCKCTGGDVPENDSPTPRRNALCNHGRILVRCRYVGMCRSCRRMHNIRAILARKRELLLYPVLRRLRAPLVLPGQSLRQVFCTHLLFCFAGLVLLGNTSTLAGNYPDARSVSCLEKPLVSALLRHVYSSTI